MLLIHDRDPTQQVTDLVVRCLLLGQRAEGRGQRAEGRGQRAEVSLSTKNQQSTTGRMILYMITYFIEILTFHMFFLLLYRMIKKLARFEATLIILIIVIATYGEYLNLFVFKATAYTDRVGVPVYIILGGALIGWLYYKLPCVLAQKLNRDNLPVRIGLFLLLSLLFPVIEICGIKLGLWHWLKPYSLTNPWWWIGVWKFYVIFLGMLPLAGLVRHRVWSKELRDEETGNR